MWWRTAISLLAGLLLLYALGILFLWRTYRHQQDVSVLKSAVRLLPDFVRLLRRLAADPTLPRGVRIRMTLIAAYLVFPLDLVPDFIPVLGYADDALIVAFALRSVVRRAGIEALERHWPGTPEGFSVVRRLAGFH